MTHELNWIIQYIADNFGYSRQEIIELMKEEVESLDDFVFNLLLEDFPFGKAEKIAKLLSKQKYKDEILALNEQNDIDEEKIVAIPIPDVRPQKEENLKKSAERANKLEQYALLSPDPSAEEIKKLSRTFSLVIERFLNEHYQGIFKRRIATHFGTPWNEVPTGYGNLSDLVTFLKMYAIGHTSRIEWKKVTPELPLFYDRIGEFFYAQKVECQRKKNSDYLETLDEKELQAIFRQMGLCSSFPSSLNSPCIETAGFYYCPYNELWHYTIVIEILSYLSEEKVQQNKRF